MVDIIKESNEDIALAIGEIGTTHNNVINMVTLRRSVQRAMMTQEMNSANLMEKNGEH